MRLEDVHFLPTGIGVRLRFDNSLFVVELRTIDEVLKKDTASDGVEGGGGCSGGRWRRRRRHGREICNSSVIFLFEKNTYSDQSVPISPIFIFVFSARPPPEEEHVPRFFMSTALAIAG